VLVLKGHRPTSRRYYSREQAVLVALSSVVTVGIGLAFAINSRASSGERLVLGGVIVALAVGLGLGRCARSGVTLSGQRFKVVNPFRTYHFTIEQVRCFDLGRFGLNPRIGKAHLTDGRVIRLWGIQGLDPRFRPAGNRRAEATIEMLNQALR
jgi:hypothetical protein